MFQSLSEMDDQLMHKQALTVADLARRSQERWRARLHLELWAHWQRAAQSLGECYAALDAADAVLARKMAE